MRYKLITIGNDGIETTTAWSVEDERLSGYIARQLTADGAADVLQQWARYHDFQPHLMAELWSRLWQVIGELQAVCQHHWHQPEGLQERSCDLCGKEEAEPSEGGRKS